MALSAAALFFAVRALLTVRQIRSNVRAEYRARVLSALDDMIAQSRLHEDEYEATDEESGARVSPYEFHTAAQRALVLSIRERVAAL